MDEQTQNNALEGLLSNPALLGALSGLMRNAPRAEQTASAETGETDASTALPDAASAGNATQAASDGIARVLSDPAMMAKLPQMMELIKPMLAASAESKDAIPAHAQPKLSRDAHCRNELLLALKPFLSKERAAAVDAILRLSQLGNVLQTLK